MLDNYSTDILPFDVAQRVEEYKAHSSDNDEEWVIFKSKFEDRLWIVKKLLEEDSFQVIACPIAYQSNYYPR